MQQLLPRRTHPQILLADDSWGTLGRTTPISPKLWCYFCLPCIGSKIENEERARKEKVLKIRVREKWSKGRENRNPQIANLSEIHLLSSVYNPDSKFHFVPIIWRTDSARKKKKKKVVGKVEKKTLHILLCSQNLYLVDANNASIFQCYLISWSFLRKKNLLDFFSFLSFWLYPIIITSPQWESQDLSSFLQSLLQSSPL